jgi:hypothetical protein
VVADELAGKRTGERIQILRERRGITRPVLAGLVGMSSSWLKGIERGTWRGQTDLDLGGVPVPVGSFTRIPHDAVPAIREAVRDP